MQLCLAVLLPPHYSPHDQMKVFKLCALIMHLHAHKDKSRLDL